MAIEDILAALDAEADGECNQVLEEARAHADSVIAEAEREARRIRTQQMEAVERAAKAKAMRRVNTARLESKMLVSQAKGDGVAGVFDLARKRLSTVRERPDYDRLFRALAEEALAGIAGDVVLKVADADVSRAGDAAASLGVPAKVEGGLDTAGGLIVEANGGRIIRRNTLEERLDRVEGLLQADVARTLLA